MGTRGHLVEIDVLKGLAILAVVTLHGAPGNDLWNSWSAFHVGQAVPVFFVVMGLNATRSMRRRAPQGARDAYTRGYFAGRAERLLAPFAVLWLTALAAGAIGGGLHVGPLAAVGVLPLAGPGNYFVTIAFEFALVFPALSLGFRAAPRATVALCFAASASFELAAPHVFHGADPYLYDASILRYAGPIALGMWIASDTRLSSPRNRWALGLSAASIAYLVAYHLRPGAFSWLRDDFGTTTNFIACFYALLLVLLALRYLPRLGPLAALGRASWHIFLVQIVWFALVPPRSLAALPLHVAGASALGYALYRVMATEPVANRIRALVAERASGDEALALARTR